MSTQNSYDGNRAAKGQAINLAVQTAIAKGEEQNLKFIFKEYLRYLQIANVIQGSKESDLVAALEDKNLNKLLDSIKELGSKV